MLKSGHKLIEKVEKLRNQAFLENLQRDMGKKQV